MSGRGPEVIAADLRRAADRGFVPPALAIEAAQSLMLNNALLRLDAARLRAGGDPPGAPKPQRPIVPPNKKPLRPAGPPKFAREVDPATLPSSYVAGHPDAYFKDRD